MNTTKLDLKERLRIPVQVRGSKRRFYLTPPDMERNRPYYYVRFEVPRDLRETKPELPAVIYHSTGTCLLEAARLRAARKIEDVFAGRWSEVEKGKLAARGATIGDILDAYKPSARDVNPRVARRNCNSLEMILREVFPRANVRELRADAVLTGKTLRSWIALRKERFVRLDLVLQERAAITMNSTLLMARSVVARKTMDLYAHLKMPDLTDFYAVKGVPVDKDVSYQPLPAACIERMEQVTAELRRGNYKGLDADGEPMSKEMQRGVYLVYVLMSRLGLRNCEVYAARHGWIERHGVGIADFVIKRRPDFVAKNKRYRQLDIEAELLAELDQYRELPEAWIIPGTARYDVCYRHINAVLRPLMPPGRDKAAYELRKHAGSVIVSRPESDGGGIVAASAFLGDTIATTEKHYVAFLRKIRGIRRSEISTAGTLAA